MKVQGIYNNKILKKGLEFAGNKGSLFLATTALAFSAIRPGIILLTPKTKKENKQLASAKSFASTAINYLLMLAVSLPVASALNNIDNSPKKYLTKSTISNLSGGTKNLTKAKPYIFATQLFRLGLGFVTAIPKSIATCALIPPIMMKFFPNTNNNQIQSKPENKNIHFNGLESSLTNRFAKNVKNIHKHGIEKLSVGIAKIINLKQIQNLSKKFCNTNFEQHIIYLTDIFSTAIFMHQASRNKNIKESGKNPLIYNAALSTGFCIAGGYTLNKVLEKPTDKFIKNFIKANKESPILEKYIEGIKIAKTSIILGGIYYIIIPLISTFLAERVDKKLK